MFAKLVKSTIFIAAVILFTASVQAKDYVEGKDYEVRGTVKSEKPEIREYFSFFCGHCFAMRDQFHQVRDHFLGKAEFVMNPVYVLGGDLGVYSETTYAVAQVAGVADQYEDLLFKSIHVDNEEPQNLDFFIEKLGDVGIPSEKALQSYNSFVVKGMVSSWDNSVEYAKIEAVPEIMVNGKYVVKMDDIDNVEQLNAVIDYLLTLD